MKHLLAGFTLLVLLLLAVLALPFTDSGSRALVRWLDGLGLFHIEYAGGSLLGELQLSRLEIVAGDVTVTLQDVDLRLDRSCLWRSSFCFKQLRAQRLDIDVAEGEAAAATGEDEDSYIEMPYPLKAEDLQLAWLKVSWPGGSWEQSGLSGRASWKGSHLRVPQAQLQTARLWVAKDPQASPGYGGFEPPRVFLPMKIDAGRLSIAQLDLDLAGWRDRLQGIEAAGKWRGTKLTVQRLAVAENRGEGLHLASLAGDASLDFSGRWPATLDLQARLPGEGLPALLADRALAFQARGDFGKLRGTLDIAGEPGASIDAQADILSPGLPFSARGTIKSAPEARLGDLAAGLPPRLAELRLTTPAQVTLEGDLTAQTLRVSAGASDFEYPNIALQGRAQLRGAELAVDELSLRDRGSDSAATFTGTAQLQADWSLAGTLRSEGFKLPSMSVLHQGRVQGQAELDLRAAGEGWRLGLSALDFRGEINGLPASLQGTLALDSELRLLPSTLGAQVNGAQLRLRAGGAGGREDLLDLEVDDFGRWVRGGRGSVALHARGNLRQGQFSIDGDANGIQLEGLRLPAMSLRGSLDDQRVQLAAQAQELVLQGRRLTDLALTLDGTLASHELRLTTAGVLAGEFALHGALGDEGWDGELAPLRMDTSAGAWELEQPVDMAWREGVLRVQPHCWNHPDFELCAKQLELGASGDLQLGLQGNVSAFNGFLPPDMRVEGALDSTLQAHWGGGAPLQLAGRAQASDVIVTRLFGLGESATLKWDMAQLQVHRETGPLVVDGDIVRDGRQVLVLRATLPADTQGEVSATARLDHLNLSALAPWATNFDDLGGTLSGELQLSGALHDPLLTGDVQLEDGRAVIEGNPTALTGLNLRLALQPDGGTLSGSGLLGGGDLRLDGRITRHPDYHLDLAIEGERQQILVPPSSEFRVSEKLQLGLGENLLKVSGEITVLDGVLRHEELPEGSVAVSRDVVQVDTSGRVIREERPFDVEADLWIHLDNKFDVRGKNIQTTLGGDLHLVQETDAPTQLFGGLNVLGGELRAYRQQLEIKRGTVDFSGPPQNPQLDVAAERRIRSDNVTVGAHLFGPLEQPELEIYSDPPMSQGEAMSYLVRGRGLDTGAGADGAALALAVGADVVNQSGIVRELNRLPLINNVAFGSSGEEDDTAATVSGYVGDRIYLSYGIGLYEPVNEFTARLYLQSRLWLEVVSRLENSVDLYYSFDID